MAKEQADGLPEKLDAWVAERATATGESRQEVLRQLLAAHRLLDEHPELLDGDESADDVAVDGALEIASGSLAAEINSIESRVAALEADLDEQIADVRDRVIQVKREADAKAPVDHDHPELDRRMTEGFENYEEILTHLTDATEDHNHKLSRLAGTIVDLRDRLTELEQRSNERSAAAELRREANRHGIVAAECESCGETVRLGLLDSPRCPHCEATFEEVDPKRGFFGSNTLTVGQRPALVAADSTPTDEGSPVEQVADGESAESGEQEESTKDDEPADRATAEAKAPFTFDQQTVADDPPESERDDERDHGIDPDGRTGATDR
ncbi:MAG: CopG family transcriptional regulator [Halobellus sp.]|uniref:CopG family transcriptional regulator n=1 Tax=Halobellus sp. TaxID=1979212 RepID=UPI0035D4F291